MNKVIFLLLICSATFAQKQGNNWYFGNLAGITFNGGPPTALTNGQIPLIGGHNEGSSAISDSSGAILFYSDGMTVWNKNHQFMINGNGLLGNSSSAQSSAIVPDPADPNRFFYLFTVSSGFCCNGNISDGIRYSRIDMCQDSGKGKVLSGQKNILLEDSVAEKIAVTRHANGVDYWILTHKFFSDRFYAFLLTNAGITTTVITSIGATHGGQIHESMGQLKFSPNGQRVAIGAANAGNILELFDFDDSTGVLSNLMSLYKTNNNRADAYGVEFSPNNNVLYVQGLSNLGIVYPFLAQYDLSSNNLNTINASLIELYHNTTGMMGPKGLQLGPDGKIYQPCLNSPTFLDAINNPNVVGTGCNFQLQAVSLNGKPSSYSLPTFIAGYSYSNNYVLCMGPAGIAEKQAHPGIQVYPNPSGGAVTVQFEQFGALTQAFLVYDVSGALVFESSDEGSGKITLPEGELNPGFYYYKLRREDEIIGQGKLLIE